MKLPVSTSNVRLPLPTAGGGISALRNGPRRSTRGVALVVTLLLLAVITFMAVTFLVVSRNEHGNVATQTDMNTAKYAADAALQRAMMELAAPILAATNPFNYGLLVSTNYVNASGFYPGVSSPTNVNYDFVAGGGGALNLAQSLQNLTNLLYNSQPPVFVVTNALVAKSNEFRRYIDLNRNGTYDPNGLQPVISPDPAKPYYNVNGGTMATPTPGLTVSNNMTGDPQWIGLLQNPQFSHSANNQFVSRYAYLVVPAGQTLDVNSMHNDARGPSGNQGMGLSDGFLRNQGVLTAELNLAAFLADLNTNLWPVTPQSVNPYQFFPYTYLTNGTLNRGAAFDDALGLLAYRYNNSVKSLANVSTLFGNPGDSAFMNPIDAYSLGPLMDGTTWPPPGLVNPNPSRVSGKTAWQGADSPNRFSSPQDFFDVNKTAANRLTANARNAAFSVAKRLDMTRTNISTYDRSTFYRLLSQLGTDSDPDPGGKMNLNYLNVDQYGRVVPGMVTKFQSWPAAQFFTNAAIRLLADAGYAVGGPNGLTNLLATNVVNGVLVTNLQIPIWPTNYYTPSVHRLLQLAANLYDSTTAGVGTYPYPPSVFRPLFKDTVPVKSRKTWITGYEEITNNVVGDLSILTAKLPHDLSSTLDTTIQKGELVYGVPLILGAKKGLPNFNQFQGQTVIDVTRKLLFSRPNGSSDLPVNRTNQMFLVGITNFFGIQAWNSYVSNWSALAPGRKLRFYVMPDSSAVISNRTSPFNVGGGAYRPYYVSPTDFNNWPGYNGAGSGSFIVPLTNNVAFLSNAVFVDASHTFVSLLAGAAAGFETSPPDGNFYLPQWDLNVNSRVRFAVLDTSNNRLLDYVNLSDQIHTNLTDILALNGQCGDTYSPNGQPGSMWCTNRLGNKTSSDATFGVMNQVLASMGTAVNPNPALDGLDWNFVKLDVTAALKDKTAQMAYFAFQFGLNTPNFNTSGFTKTNSFGALSPIRRILVVNNWAANDPLVHYTVADLSDLVFTNGVTADYPPSDPMQNLVGISARYEPWGRTRSPTKGKSQGVGAWEIGAKDPVPAKTGKADFWDFQTNKFPNPGWIGGVHRGTPWQTVYFKSPVTTDATTGIPQSTTNTLSLQSWLKWTGNRATTYNFGQLSTSIFPLFVNSNSPPLADAFLTQPTNDWRLLDLFSTSFSDTASKGQLSVNQPGLAAWSAVLSGVVALTNTVDVNGNAVISPCVIQPGGVYDPNNANTWTPLVRIVNGLNLARTNCPGHIFTHLGDILTVPELTVRSPYLDTSVRLDLLPPGAGAYALSDAAYERIPRQILGLLKADPAPRFVIYSYGQTLKPAPHSAYTGSGPYFGLITNYQIMAEVATRAVVRFDGAPTYLNGTPSAITNLHPVIESFNVLRPD